MDYQRHKGSAAYLHLVLIRHVSGFISGHTSSLCSGVSLASGAGGKNPLRHAGSALRPLGGPPNPSRMTPPLGPLPRAEVNPAFGTSTAPPLSVSEALRRLLHLSGLSRSPHLSAFRPLQLLRLYGRINSVMKKLLLIAVPFIGVGLAKSEAVVMEQKTQLVEIVRLDPRKNYRAKLARQYFGSGGGSCRKWNRFCGR